jgi:hypothetical protein
MSSSQLNSNFTELAEDLYVYISKKDISGIIDVLDQIKNKSEYESLCSLFREKYNFSLYNKIWNFVALEDYEKINLALRKANC